MTRYHYQKATAKPFATIEHELREALKRQGFGVLTEIDAQKTMKEKLGVETGQYKILGACNPEFAHQAMAAEPDVGVLLPCNVLLRANGQTTIVSAILPTVQMGNVGNASLLPIATEVESRLIAAVDEAVGP